MRTPTARSVRVLVVGLLTLAGLASTAEALNLVITGRIAADGQRTHSLYVGMNDYYLTVNGQGRVSDDLDCWVYDSGGTLVDADTDYTDNCVLETPGIGTHRLVIRNYGRYSNRYEVHQGDVLY